MLKKNDGIANHPPDIMYILVHHWENASNGAKNRCD